MFDFVRQHTRVIQFVMLLLIIPAFIGVGVVQTYSSMREDKNAVAEVKGETITLADWENQRRQQADRLMQQQPGIDPQLLESPRFKQQVLDMMLRDRVLAVATQELRLAVPDARLKRLFAADPDPNTQPFRNADGSLNKDALAPTGMSPAMFTERLRAEYATRQVIGGVLLTSLAPKAVATRALESVLQKREVQVATFDAKSYLASLQPTEAELKKFYEDPAHAAQYRVPESVDIEYLVLDLEALKAGVDAPEADLRKLYDDERAKGRFTAPEERRASHILITAAKDAPAAERQAARARAEALLAEVRKAPGRFADVARKNSQDPGSAEKGGDLDFFGRGAMVKPFEDAAFALKPGQISDVVESDFGYHVIMLTATRGGEAQAFEAVRGELAEEMKTEQARRRYAELAQRFSDLVYEKSDSLKPAADELKLPVRTAAGVTRSGSSVLGDLATPKLIKALFDEKNRQLKRNTEATEAGPNRLVAGRVVKHLASRQRPFAEVQAQVREQWLAQAAARMAKEEAERSLKAWQAQPQAAASRLGAPVLLSRSTSMEQPVQVMEAAMKAPHDKLPAWALADLGPQGWAVVRINKVLPPEVGEPERQAAMAQYAQMWGVAEAKAYYEALRKRFKASVTAAGSAAVAASEPLGGQ